MTRPESLVLRAAAVWTLFIWAVLVRNILAGDRELGFKLVHMALAVVSIGFAVLTWRIAWAARGRSQG